MKQELSERTKKIINDIAEDIDCRESRKVLRETIKELTDALEDKFQNAVVRSNARLMRALKKWELHKDEPDTRTIHTS